MASFTHVPAEELKVDTELLLLLLEPEPPDDEEPPLPLPELEGVATDGVEGVAVDGVATTAAVLLDGIIIVDGAALAAKTAPNVKPNPNVSVAIKRFIYPSIYQINLIFLNETFRIITSFNK